MSAAESAFHFDAGGRRLLGILHPATQGGDLGVVIAVGGPQYRVGSHRQFVLLARRLADQGFPVLRFDFAGMGDSEGELPAFEASAADIGPAISELLRRTPGLKQVVLWGLCDGASAALLHLDTQADPRVAGLVLVNPWVRSAASLAKTQVKHYYLDRLRQPQFWRKLLRGGVGLRALGSLAANLRLAGSGQRADGAAALPFQGRMARAWAAFPGAVLLLLSGNDYTAREFSEVTASDSAWQQALRQRPPLTRTLEGADHTCASADWRGAAENATLDWLRSLRAGAC